MIDAAPSVCTFASLVFFVYMHSQMSEQVRVVSSVKCDSDSFETIEISALLPRLCACEVDVIGNLEVYVP
jgi:hypothetical protein